MAMAITNLNELCRLCLEHSEMLYKLDSDFCILVMESGASITISDAMKYLSMDIKIVADDPDTENLDESETEDKEDPKLDSSDDPNLPKSLCQECLEKLQSAYEFKYRCEENRSFLRKYLKEAADSKIAEERAVKEAALAALDIDIDNLDNLPDKLVLKQIKKEKKPRKPRDPSRPAIVRRRRIPDKNVIIAEDSQVDSAAYVRKIITTPEQSPEQKRASKRKSKHVVIEDIFVGGGKRSDPNSTKNKNSSFNSKENESSDVAANQRELPTLDSESKESKPIRNDDEPIFEDDDDFQEPEEPKRSKRAKK